MEGDLVWAAVGDALRRGAHHELNNRIASLAAVEQVISAGGDPTPALREALVTELKRMRGAIELLGRIPAARPSTVAAVRVQDALATVAALVPLHHEARDAEVRVRSEGDPLPVRADLAALERSLLVIIVAAARSLADAPDPHVTVECTSDASRTSVGVAPLELTEAERLAIAAWLRPSGGDVSRTGPRAYSISIPAIRPASS